MKYKLLLIICILLCDSGLEIKSELLIVAKNGGAFNTIQAGINSAIPGDTVLVKAGVYTELVNVSKSGIEGKYITLMGEPGAIIDATSVPLAGTCGLIFIENKSFIRVIGLTIQNAILNSKSVFQAGIWIRGAGSNIEIRRNKILNIVNSLKNSGCHGIGVYGTNGTISLSSVIIDGNEVFNCQTGWSESLVVNGNVDGFVVSGNIVHDNNNIGIDFIGHEGECPNPAMDRARNGLCIDNRVYNITSNGNPAYGNEKSADGIYIDGGLNIIIERNRIDKCDIGIELASEHFGKNTENITVRNNFISRSYQGNLQAGGYDLQRGNAVNCSFLNNTTYQSEQGELVLQSHCNGIIIKNNIFVSKNGNEYLNQWGSQNADIIVSNNLYWGSGENRTGAWNDALALFADPRLRNSYFDMHLSENSPAINRGVDVDKGDLDIDNEQRIIGESIDIGADEFNPALGMNPVHVEHNFLYLPNYGLKYFTIIFPRIAKTVVLNLYNLNGQKLFCKSYNDVIEISEGSDFILTRGVYLIEINIDGQISTEKIQI